MELGFELNSLTPGLTLFSVGLSFRVVFNAIYLMRWMGVSRLWGTGKPKTGPGLACECLWAYPLQASSNW